MGVSDFFQTRTPAASARPKPTKSSEIIKGFQDFFVSSFTAASPVAVIPSPKTSKEAVAVGVKLAKTNFVVGVNNFVITGAGVGVGVLVGVGVGVGVLVGSEVGVGVGVGPVMFR